MSEYPSDWRWTVVDNDSKPTAGEKPVKRPRGKRSGAPLSGGAKPWQEVRADKVALARRLIADPNYPSKETLEAVAEILVRGRSLTRREST